MKRLISIYYSLIYTIFVTGQPEPSTVNFIEAQPRWSILIEDINFKDLGQSPAFDQYNMNFNTFNLRHGDSIILYHTSTNFKGDWWGHIIRSVDIKSGDTNWSHFSTIFNNELQDYYNQLYIKDQSLIMGGLKRNGPPRPSNVFFNLATGAGRVNPGYKIIDTKTGEVESTVFSKRDSVPFGFLLSNMLYNVTTDKMVYAVQRGFEIEDPVFRHGWRFWEMDEDANFIDQENASSEIEYSTPDELDFFSMESFFTPYIRVKDNIFINLAIQDHRDAEKYKYQFVWFDISDPTDVKLINRLNVEQYIPPGAFNWDRFHNQKRGDGILLSHYYKNPTTGNLDRTYAIIMSVDGEVKAAYPDCTVDGHVYHSIHLMRYEKDRAYLAGLPSRTGRPGFDILQSNFDTHQLNYINSLTSDNQGVTFVKPLSFVEIYDDGLMVVSGATGPVSFNLGTAVRHYCFDASDLGIDVKVKTQETYKPYAPLTIFPNPVMGSVNIITDMPYDDINLYNKFGQRMSISRRGNYIDTEQLPSGVYFLYLIKNGQKISDTQKLVKIE